MGRSRRWDLENPGNQLILDERNEIAIELLRLRGLWPTGGYRILEIGCGDGGELARFADWGAAPSDLLGIDLAEHRVRSARSNHPEIEFRQGDASRLELPDESFRLVLAFTVLSSVLADEKQFAIAREVDRVLVPSGCVLWYDFHVSHPGNRRTRGVRARRIRELFPSYDMDMRRVTVIPPLVRRLRILARPMYPMLRAVPLLRTHYLATLKK